MPHRLLTSLIAGFSMTAMAGLAHAQDDGSASTSHGKVQRSSGKSRSRHETGTEAAATNEGAAPAAAQTTPAPVAPVAAPPATASFVCTLNREAIIKGAAVNVAAAQRLAQLRQSAQAEIADATKSLQADTKTLDADNRPSTDDGMKKDRNALAERGRLINERAELLNQELSATLQSVSQQIQTAALPVIQNVEKEHNCLLLLNREVVLDGSTVDITQPVLAAMDAQLHGRPFDLVTLATPPQR